MGKSESKADTFDGEKRVESAYTSTGSGLQRNSIKEDFDDEGMTSLEKIVQDGRVEMVWTPIKSGILKKEEGQENVSSKSLPVITRHAKQPIFLT